MIRTLARTSILLAAVLGVPLALAEEAPANGSSLKDAAQGAVSSAISAGKNLLGGVTAGVTEGRESAQGTDGSTAISEFKQLEGRVQVKLLKAEPEGDNLNVVFGFKNETASPLRLINLRQNGALLAIDQEGYSSNLLVGLDNPDDLSIPAKTGVRQKFVFEGPVVGVKSVRLWGQDFELGQ